MYPMDNSSRGRAIIISNEYFVLSTLQTRLGTKADVDNLTELFKNGLHFTVATHHNLSVQVGISFYFDDWYLGIVS